MSKKVLIIDAGLGNIGSVKAAFRRFDCLVSCYEKPPNENEKDFSHLVLPGVVPSNLVWKLLKRQVGIYG